MAYVKSTTRQWLDVGADDFSAEVQALLEHEREIYNLLKAAKAETLAAIRQEVPLPQGKEIVSMAYTRWGQLQIVVDDKAAPKAPSAVRASLADFIAAQAASGLRG